VRETSWNDWPVLDAAQMLEVDRLMVDELQVSLLQMMENAGRNLAWLAIRRFAPARVVVLAGGGGNGGGGLAAARHLANHGVQVDVWQVCEPGVAATRQQRDALVAWELPVSLEAPSHNGVDLVIDAMVGYSLRGEPSGAVADAIAWAADSPAPLLSLDVPTGFDASTGSLRHPHVTATATLTLAAPKRGLEHCAAAGEIYVGDISVPAQLYARLGIVPTPEFGDEWVVRVLTDGRRAD
jgi:NAD(P)H-hydrate epimerase